MKAQRNFHARSTETGESVYVEEGEDIPNDLNVTNPKITGKGQQAEAGEDYGSLTVDELREELANRDLSTSGNKPDLVARLEEDDAEGIV